MQSVYPWAYHGDLQTNNLNRAVYLLEPRYEANPQSYSSPYAVKSETRGGQPELDGSCSERRTEVAHDVQACVRERHAIAAETERVQAAQGYHSPTPRT